MHVLQQQETTDVAGFLGVPPSQHLHPTSHLTLQQRRPLAALIRRMLLQPSRLMADLKHKPL